MDTTAYLQSQGWLGAGHALHARGLSKPLLVSQKQNVLGVGKKRHDAHADQWWARAFDGCLKGLEVSRDAGQGGQERAMGLRVQGRGGGLDALRSGKAGLYGFFVRGEGLRGTFVEETVREVVVVEEVGGVETKRRKGLVDEERTERTRRRKEWKEREVAGSVVMVEQEILDGELSKRLRKEERRKRRRDRECADEGTVTAAGVAETLKQGLSSSLRKKKRRRVEASEDGGSSELVPSQGHGSIETSVLEGRKTGATDIERKVSKEEKDESLIEKLERRRRRAARKALKAEQNRSTNGQAGQEADETNKVHRKKKRKHTEKQT